MKIPEIDGLVFGGDYNPEQWPESVWPEDIRLMREAGVNLVSIGVFAWSWVEPEAGQWNLGGLDRVLDLLHAGGIRANLGTGTAAPPPWLARLHPDILPVTAQGTTLWPGSRGHYCPSSSAYREAVARHVQALAERYAGHPALSMWHVNNEYGPVCYCDQSARRFRAWLRDRFGTLAALNEAWGTAVWGQQYSTWEEILPPRAMPTFANPTHLLDWQRFCSDVLLECFTLERDILRAATPSVPVTTNFMDLNKPLDYRAWAAQEDLVALDLYPEPLDPEAPIRAACNHDLMRSLARGPWLLMEQASSQVNWREYNPAKRPGQMRRLSYQAIARGSEGAMFFQWRGAPVGAEKFHSAMLPAGGTDTRIWREIRDLGQELQALGAVRGGGNAAQVAILFDWQCWWALETPGKPSRDLRYLDQLWTYYTPLWRANIPVDFVPPLADLSAYRVLLVPNAYLCTREEAAWLDGWVQSGGRLVMSFFSGMAGAEDHLYPEGPGGPLLPLLGIRIEEFDAYLPGQTNRIRDYAGEKFECDLWSDVIRTDGAEAIALYMDDYYHHRPAVTRHGRGQGQAIYLGTRPEERYLSRILLEVCREAGVEPVLRAPEAVEAVRRGQFLFLLNHRSDDAVVPVPRPGIDALSGEPAQASVTVPAGGLVVVDEHAAPRPGASSRPRGHG